MVLEGSELEIEGWKERGSDGRMCQEFGGDGETTESDHKNEGEGREFDKSRFLTSIDDRIVTHRDGIKTMEFSNTVGTYSYEAIPFHMSASGRPRLSTRHFQALTMKA